MALHSLKPTKGFQQQLTPSIHPHPFLGSSQSASLSQDLDRTRIQHLAQIDSHVEGIMGSISQGKPNTIHNQIQRSRGDAPC